MIEILFGIVLIVFLLWDKIFGIRPNNYPPGPTRYPIFGNLKQFGKNPMEALSKWKEQYGNVVGLRFGEINLVLLSGYDTIKEAYEKNEFASRPTNIGVFQVLGGGKKIGLLISDGPHWVELRRFALKNLRDFGFGKRSMEAVIHEDVTDFIATLKKTNGAPIFTDRMLSLVVLSALWNIVAGEKFAHDDPKFKKVSDELAAVITGDVSGPSFFMPSIAKLLPMYTGWNNLQAALKSAKRLISGIIFTHKSTFDPNNLRDFIDVYLNQLKDTTDVNSPFYKDLGDQHMLITITNLFVAGSETTSNTLNWAFQYLAEHQNVQEKLYQELKNKVGDSKLPGFDDRNELPYTEAVMLEVFRMSSIVPVGVFHSTSENVKFHGYNIPKDTAIMAFLYDIHYDEAIWGDPKNFRPERFLSSDGKRLEKVGNVVPFGIGKRLCIGETLARNEFYLLLTGVIQRFNITFDKNETSYEPRPPSISRSSPLRKLCFKDRN